MSHLWNFYEVSEKKTTLKWLRRLVLWHSLRVNRRRPIGPSFRSINSAFDCSTKADLTNLFNVETLPSLPWMTRPFLPPRSRFEDRRFCSNLSRTAFSDLSHLTFSMRIEQRATLVRHSNDCYFFRCRFIILPVPLTSIIKCLGKRNSFTKLLYSEMFRSDVFVNFSVL